MNQRKHTKACAHHGQGMAAAADSCMRAAAADSCSAVAKDHVGRYRCRMVTALQRLRVPPSALLLFSQQPRRAVFLRLCLQGPSPGILGAALQSASERWLLGWFMMKVPQDGQVANGPTTTRKWHV